MKRLKRFKTPHKRYWKDVEVCYCVKDEYFKLTKVSVMASITSNNEKMPLFIIASANTEEEKEDLIGEINQPNQSSFSTKSYMTTDNFIEYLQFLRKQFNSNTTINLIVDSYASHKSLRSLVKAKQLNINLIFIPSGLTDNCNLWILQFLLHSKK